MRLPTVRIKHKRKGHVLVINQQDWAQDLGRFKYRDFERVGERHNEAEDPVEVEPAPAPEPKPAQTRRPRARKPIRAPFNDG